MKRDSTPFPPEQTDPQAAPDMIDLKVNPGQRLKLQVRVNTAGEVVLWQGVGLWLTEGARSGWLYAWLGLLAAAAALFTALARYPAHVLPDEVYASLRAVDLLSGGFRGEDGTLLPTFLRGSTPFAVGTGAYLQVLPQFLRLNTLTWIRGLNAGLSLLAALGMACWLHTALGLRRAWAYLPLLAGVPAWFFFSRTGLDISLAASLFTAALCCYGFYRAGRMGFAYGAGVLGLLAFYAAPAARLAVPTAALLLAIADWNYHWLNRHTGLRALALAMVLTLPLGFFLIRHPDGFWQDLAAAGSFLPSESNGWLKAAHFLLNVTNGFNPFAWFLPNPNTPAQYRMGAHPPLPYLLVPFVLWGAWLALKNIRRPDYRLLWIGLLAAAAGAAPYGGTLPASLLAVPLLAVLALIGMDVALTGAAKKWPRIPAWIPNLALFIVVSGGCLGLLVSALTGRLDSPADYGREGTQYGAPQIYAAATNYLAANPDKMVLVWPGWSSDADALQRFFAPEVGDRIRSSLLDSFFYRINPAIGQVAFLLPHDQYLVARDSGKFDVRSISEIDYPDGSPAFVLAEMEYTPGAAAIMQLEAISRRSLTAETIEVAGGKISVRHSVFDLGTSSDLFDGNPESLVRSAAANPLVVELAFPQPRSLSGVVLLLGSEPVTLTAEINPGSNLPLTFSRRAAASNGAKELTLEFEGAPLVEVLRLEVLDGAASEPAHVHLWEIRLVDAINITPP